MKLLRLVLLALVMNFCAANFVVFSQDSKTVGLPALTKEQWREDLRYLAAELPRRHKNAFHTVSRADFEKAVSDLDKQIPSLQNHEIVIGLKRIIAMVGDAHTDLNLSPNFFKRYPLTTYWFGNELRITRTDFANRSALGAKVVKIGDLETKEAAARINSLVPRENDYWQRFMGASFFTTAEILHALKISPEANRARWTFEDNQGKQFTLDVEALPSDAKIEWLSTLKEAPLYRQRQNEPVWFTVLPDGKTVYVNFRGEPGNDVFGKVSADLFKTIDESKTQRIVIDVRLNVGGDFHKARRFLLSEMKKRDNFRLPGSVYVITGRATQSAAVVNAIDFRKELKAILVGEPTGGRPNGYSENDEMRLPNSKLQLSYSTRYYKFQETDSAAVMPDKLIEPSWEVYPTGRDAVLEWILAQPIGK